VRLHKRAGEVLETAYAAGIEPHLAELAHHFCEAAATGDVDKAIGYARRAGEWAAGLLAFEEAVRLFRLGLSLSKADAPGRRRQRCELLVVLGDVQARTGDTPAARGTFLAAADLAAEIGAAEPLARAALGYGGRFMWTRSEDDRVVPLLEQAAQALGGEESPLRVIVLARLASALRALAPERSSDLSEEALAMGRRLGDPSSLALAISGRLWSTVAPIELDQRWALATELAQAEDKERAYEGHGYRMIVLLARGDVPGFRQELAQLAEIADALGQPSQRWWVAAQRANLALLEGRLGDAEKLIETARTLGERAESYDALNFFQLQRFALRSEQGRLAEVLPDLEQAVARDPSRPLLRSALALTQWEVGQEEPARRLFAELAAKEFGQLPVNNDWLFAASLLAKLAASAGEADRADDLYSRLAPFDGLNVDNTEVSSGAVSHYLALLSVTTRRFEQAERHFEDALALNERMGARPWLAHTQREYGRMLAERGRPERAHRLISAAVATYRELGLKRYAAKTTTLARELGSLTRQS
jgi:tetratricopeptide (TPR) repeat protein